MNCLEAQGLITQFIHDELECDKLESFLSHIDSCPECKEEVEVHYIIFIGMKQLDEEDNILSDLHEMFLQKIKKAQDKILKKKIYYIRKRIVLVIIVMFFAAFSGLQISEHVIEEVIEEDSTSVAVSNFILKKNFFEDKYSKLDQYIEDNFDNIVAYKTMHETIKGDTDEQENSFD